MTLAMRFNDHKLCARHTGAGDAPPGRAAVPCTLTYSAPTVALGPRTQCDRTAADLLVLAGDPANLAGGTALSVWLLRLATARARVLGLRGEDVEDCAVGFVCHIWPACRETAFLERPPQGRRAWLLRCADNWVRSERRRAVRLALVETGFPTLHGSRGTAAGLFSYRDDLSAPEVCALRAELARRIADAARQLKDGQWDLFVARHVEGLSYEELEAVTGRSRGALRLAVWSVRRRLRRVLEGAGLCEEELASYLEVLAQ